MISGAPAGAGQNNALVPARREAGQRSLFEIVPARTTNRTRISVEIQIDDPNLSQIDPDELRRRILHAASVAHPRDLSPNISPLVMESVLQAASRRFIPLVSAVAQEGVNLVITAFGGPLVIRMAPTLLPYAFHFLADALRIATERLLRSAEIRISSSITRRLNYGMQTITTTFSTRIRLPRIANSGREVVAPHHRILLDSERAYLPSESLRHRPPYNLRSSQRQSQVEPAAHRIQVLQSQDGSQASEPTVATKAEQPPRTSSTLVTSSSASTSSSSVTSSTSGNNSTQGELRMSRK